MKHFTMRLLAEAIAHSAAGFQALHTHRFIRGLNKTPQCFVQALERGEELAHLFDRDEKRLRATVKRLGVRVVVVERAGTDKQHVDLCGAPLRRALAECTQE